MIISIGINGVFPVPVIVAVVLNVCAGHPQRTATIQLWNDSAVVIVAVFVVPVVASVVVAIILIVTV